jgi:hypothetical protein
MRKTSYQKLRAILNTYKESIIRKDIIKIKEFFKLCNEKSWIFTDVCRKELCQLHALAIEVVNQ